MKQPHAAQTAQLLQQIARTQHMEPGKLCVLRQGPNGAYHNLQWREQGKALSRYVPAEQVTAPGWYSLKPSQLLMASLAY